MAPASGPRLPFGGRRRAAAVLAAALLLAGSGCSRGADSSEPAPEPPPVEVPLAPGRTHLPGFGEVELRIVPGPDGEPIVICVLLAESSEQRRRGLMEVTDPDLGGYDGMLFRFPEETTSGFWMKHTPLPLSIAYLDEEGATVDTKDMEPCVDVSDGCPIYGPAGPYRMALEVPQGGLAELGLGRGSPSRVEVGGPCRAPPAS